MPPMLHVVKDEISPRLAKVARGMDQAGQRKLLVQWGAVIRKEAQETAIRKGGRRFWRAIARSVNVRELGGRAVQVASDHVAAAQMQYGGTISAPGKHSEKPAQALTIPIAGSPGEGHRAREFQQKLFVPPGTSVLGYSMDGQFVGLFVLRKSVKGPHSPWFPDTKRAAELGDGLARKLLAS